MLEITKRLINKNELFISEDKQWIGTRHWMVKEVYASCGFKPAKIVVDRSISSLLDRYIPDTYFRVIKTNLQYNGDDYSCFIYYVTNGTKTRFFGINTKYTNIIDNFVAFADIGRSPAPIFFLMLKEIVGMVTPTSLRDNGDFLETAIRVVQSEEGMEG